MASSGALAELARLPPSRKALVFALIGAVIGLGYWRLVYQSLEERLEAAQAEHDGKLKTRKRLTDDLPKYEELRAHMEKLTEQIEKNQAALPSEAELPAFFEMLQHKVAESGVEIRKWTHHNEEPVESFVRVPVEIELTGTFMQIKRFFASLIQPDVRLPPGSGGRTGEERERIVSIESLSLGSPTVRSREMVLTARFTAVTFRQEARPGGPDKAPNGQPAAAGEPRPAAPQLPATPPATTPSPPPPPLPSVSPPLPSAATPAGARARIDPPRDPAAARDRGAGGADEAKPPAGGRGRLQEGL